MDRTAVYGILADVPNFDTGGLPFGKKRERGAVADPFRDGVVGGLRANCAVRILNHADAIVYNPEARAFGALKLGPHHPGAFRLLADGQDGRRSIRFEDLSLADGD